MLFLYFKPVFGLCFDFIGLVLRCNCCRFFFDMVCFGFACGCLCGLCLVVYALWSMLTTLMSYLCFPNLGVIEPRFLELPDDMP
jgi:hypothetical protein